MMQKTLNFLKWISYLTEEKQKILMDQLRDESPSQRSLQQILLWDNHKDVPELQWGQWVHNIGDSEVSKNANFVTSQVQNYCLWPEQGASLGTGALRPSLLAQRTGSERSTECGLILVKNPALLEKPAMAEQTFTIHLLRECDLIHFIVKDTQTSVLLQGLYCTHMK